MSRVFICFFVLFSIAVQFGECEDEANCDKEIIPGCDKIQLSSFENTFRKIVEGFGKLDFGFVNFGKDKSPSKIKGCLSKWAGKFQNIFQLIAPGTKWCGDGDKAKDDMDLGKFNDTDACCRAHDKCNSNIVAGEIKANLINHGLFTKSAEHCDSEFHECLTGVNSPLAKSIGISYFNILQPQCFRCVCPIDDCKPDVDGMECCKKYEWVNAKKF